MSETDRPEQEKNSVNRMGQVSVRKQKIRKNTVKIRLLIFGTLAGALILFSVFSRFFCPYDPYLQDLTIAKSAPSAAHLLGTDCHNTTTRPPNMDIAKKAICKKISPHCFEHLMHNAEKVFSGEEL